MSSHEDGDERVYQVVANHEEQYSIWPADREIPSGWRVVGQPGGKEECLATVEAVWTDMRPLSLRRAMGAARRQTATEMASRARP